MDQTDAKLHKQITAILRKTTKEHDLDFHHLRHRLSGRRVFIDFHLLFPTDIKLGKAHELASEIESILQSQLDMQAEISTHLEPLKHHDDIHEKYGLPI